MLLWLLITEVKADLFFMSKCFKQIPLSPKTEAALQALPHKQFIPYMSTEKCFWFSKTGENFTPFFPSVSTTGIHS
jgi:hypothetical protein